jgi:beta-lactam-binding protein with PASTA domain
VVGKPLAKAWRRIADAHCRLGRVRRVRAAKKLRGRVVRQAPQAGKRLQRYARVSLTIVR